MCVCIAGQLTLGEFLNGLRSHPEVALRLYSQCLCVHVIASYMHTHINAHARLCAHTQVFVRLRSQLSDKRLMTGAASSDILAPLFAAMDTDGDDYVSMPEFLSFWHQRQPPPPPTSASPINGCAPANALEGTQAAEAPAITAASLSPPPHSPPTLLQPVVAGSPSPSAVALQDEASQKLAEEQSRPDGLKKTAQETIALGNEILRGLSVLEEALVEVCLCACVCVCLSVGRSVCLRACSRYNVMHTELLLDRRTNSPHGYRLTGLRSKTKTAPSQKKESRCPL